MSTLSDASWNSLLDSIEENACTPFLGAGASLPLPLGKKVASRVAEKFGLLHGAEESLPRVAQFASLLHDPFSVRRFVRDLCSAQPDFSNSKQLHRVLAMLPLSYYVTTNYDDFMSVALLAAGRPPLTEVCQWHTARWDETAPRKKSRARDATVANPMVFHLHGSFADYLSMVLTDDDYLDFLVATSKYSWIIPPQVDASFSQKTIFLGYSLEDITFKIALRKLGSAVRKMDLHHLTVQVDPTQEPATAADQQRRQIRQKAVQSLLGAHAQIYWGTCEQFASELHDRWLQRHPSGFSRHVA